jgi:tetratricopeptide (TPR) repeat protein
MKRFILLCIIAAPFLLRYADASVENAEIYNRANDLYTKKEYHEALELYQELANRGIQNPSLYYNLANTYFKIGNIGYAVLYFERALLLKPFDRDIRSNLDHVKAQLEDKIRPLYDEGIFRLLRKLFSYLTLKITAYLEIILFTFLIFLLLSFLFLPHSRHRLKNPLVVVGILYMAILIGMIAQSSHEKRYPKGVILQKVLEVKSSPLAESETLFTLHEGTKFKLIEQRGEWIRFSTQDGRQGWILQDSAELIQGI